MFTESESLIFMASVLRMQIPELAFCFLRPPPGTYSLLTQDHNPVSENI